MQRVKTDKKYKKFWDLLIQWNMLEWPRGRNCAT